MEFSDGTVQYFDQPYLRPTPVSGSSPDFTDYPYTYAPDTRYGLRRIVDRFGNEVLTVDYENSTSWKFTTITLKPTGGANATISFSWGQTWTGAVGWPTLTSVTFPAIAGQGTPLTATFQKIASNFSRNNYNCLWHSLHVPRGHLLSFDSSSPASQRNRLFGFGHTGRGIQVRPYLLECDRAERVLD